MKILNTVIYLPILIAFMLAKQAFAGDAFSAGACYNITSPDYRAYCRAKALSEPGACYSIIKPDIRAMCLSETRK